MCASSPKADRTRFAPCGFRIDPTSFPGGLWNPHPPSTNFSTTRTSHLSWLSSALLHVRRGAKLIKKEVGPLLPLVCRPRATFPLSIYPTRLAGTAWCVYEVVCWGSGLCRWIPAIARGIDVPQRFPPVPWLAFQRRDLGREWYQFMRQTNFST